MSSHPSDFVPFASFRKDHAALATTPYHAAWESDRALRRRVPVTEAWRGCVALAAAFRTTESTFYHGDVALVPNDDLEWFVLRDVPIGHFPGSPTMHRRAVNFATRTSARLRHGMPVIDFTVDPRDSWDFQFMPFSTFRQKVGPAAYDYFDIEANGDTLHAEKQGREFQILNAMSARMTAFAYTAASPDGRPLRPAWAKARPPEVQPVAAEPPAQWMPVPYLAFRHDQLDEVFLAATEEQAEGDVIECVKCGEYVELARFREHARRLHVQRFEDGNFVADCPACGKPHKWHADDAVAARLVRHFPIAFKEKFLDAVGQGLPLRAVGPTVYCGPLEFARDRDFERLPDGLSRRAKLVPHRLRSEWSGKKYVVYLPATARVVVKQGTVLEPGQVWAYGLHAEPSEAWRAQDRIPRWAQLDAVCGGSEYVGLLQMEWFFGQAVPIDGAGGRELLFPADLVSFATRQVKPRGLYWDVSRAAAFLDFEKEACVFPPLRVRHWDNLLFNLPGDVVMDATITDPRFDDRAGKGKWRHRPSHRHQQQQPQPQQKPKPAAAKAGGERPKQQRPTVMRYVSAECEPGFTTRRKDVPVCVGDHTPAS